MGDAANAMAVFAFTVDGMPLIYSGQEAGLNKRLAFFEKDEIDWAGQDKSEFYTRLLKLKKDHPALWNGSHGGKAEFHHCQHGLITYSRTKDGRHVLVAINFGDQDATLDIPMADVNWKEIMSSGNESDQDVRSLGPNGYVIWTSH